jgi:hypothetical protein
VAGLPTAVSLLLLEALFMQISGVSLALTWPRRLCLFRVLLCVSLCYKLSPFQAHWGRWPCTRFLRPACLFTVHVGGGSSLLSCGVFLPPPLLQVFPLLVAGRMPPLLPSPAGLLWGISPHTLQRSGRPTLFATCLFCCYCLLFSFFLFFPLVWVGLSRGLCWSGPGLSVGVLRYRLAHLVVRVFPSHLGAVLWWRCGSPAGFCSLFLIFVYDSPTGSFL